MSLVLAKSIKKQELSNLLQTFWGKNNQISEYDCTIYPFQEVERFLKLDTNQKIEKQEIIDKFQNSLISFGLKDGLLLIAHSGLLIQSWGEIETTASIVNEKYRGQNLLSKLNIHKHRLLHLLIEKDFEITSYGILGSRSLYHAKKLFTFPDLHYQPKYLNIGPYVYKRKSRFISRKDNPYLTEYSIVRKSIILSNSVQMSSINEVKPPVIDSSILKLLPETLHQCLKHFGFTNSDTVAVQDIVEKHTSPAAIDIWHISGAISDKYRFKNDIKEGIDKGKSIIIRVPLIAKNIQTFDELKFIVKPFSSQRLIFTGLTVIDNTWCACFSIIRADYYHQFINCMEKISKLQNNPLNFLCRMIYLDSENIIRLKIKAVK